MQVVSWDVVGLCGEAREISVRFEDAVDASRGLQIVVSIYYIFSCKIECRNLDALKMSVWAVFKGNDVGKRIDNFC
jgi:hypothetical protein